MRGLLWLQSDQSCFRHTRSKIAERIAGGIHITLCASGPVAMGPRHHGQSRKYTERLFPAGGSQSRAEGVVDAASSVHSPLDEVDFQRGSREIGAHPFVEVSNTSPEALFVQGGDDAVGERFGKIVVWQ